MKKEVSVYDFKKNQFKGMTLGSVMKYLDSIGVEYEWEETRVDGYDYDGEGLLWIGDYYDTHYEVSFDNWICDDSYLA